MSLIRKGRRLRHIKQSNLLRSGLTEGDKSKDRWLIWYLIYPPSDDNDEGSMLVALPSQGPMLTMHQLVHSATPVVLLVVVQLDLGDDCLV